MAKDGKVDYLQSFMAGSWNAYNLIGFHPSTHFTPGKIIRAMEIFSKDYKVDIDVFPYCQLYLWELTLEENVKTKSRKKGGGREEVPGTPGDVSEPAPIKLTKIHKYKFALSEDDELLFCNKKIPFKIRENLKTALRCDSIKPMDLAHGTPFDLLMFHKQAGKQKPGYVKLQRANQIASKREEMINGALYGKKVDDDEDKALAEFHDKIGGDDELLPKIKKFNLSVDNVPVKSEVPGLDGYRLSEVEVEVFAPSVFHLYEDLAKAGVLEAVPSWLVKARNSGQNSVTAKYV